MSLTWYGMSCLNDLFGGLEGTLFEALIFNYASREQIFIHQHDVMTCPGKTYSFNDLFGGSVGTLCLQRIMSTNITLLLIGLTVSMSIVVWKELYLRHKCLIVSQDNKYKVTNLSLAWYGMCCWGLLFQWLITRSSMNLMFQENKCLDMVLT